jgi:hypothetical protein
LVATPVLVNLAPTTTKSESAIFATEFVDVGCGLPSSDSFTSDKLLPDPFTFANGIKVKSKTDWPFHRQEINDFFQKYELGTRPPKPSSVTGSFADG